MKLFLQLFSFNSIYEGKQVVIGVVTKYNKAFLLVLSITSFVHAQVSDNNYTNIGNIGLAITSFGRIGNEFSPSFWPAQPSCEYPFSPVRSRIEHLFSGGLWVGGYKNGQGPFVSTVTTDYYSNPSEFTQPLDSGLVERSSLLDSRYYSPSAVSHQDFVADFTDSNTIDPKTNQEIVGHTPLNVSVHEETYAWEYPIANFFVVLSFKLTNTGTTPIDSMFVGFVNDFVVRNTNYRLPTEGTPFYSGTGTGYVDSLRLAYAFDAEHHTSDLPTDNYISIKLLGVDPLSSVVKSQTATVDSLNSYTHFSAWQFRASTGDANLLSPGTDALRFEKMETSIPSNYYNDPTNPSYLGAAGNRYTLLSVGPLELPPDSSMTVAFAIVCAPKLDTGIPTDYQNNVAASRATLYANATWAQRTYNGENINGKIIRYIFPNILPPPHMHVESGNGQATIYWDDTCENVIDPFLNRKNFEGYRLYRSIPGYDFQGIQNPWEEIADFDLIDSIGLDAGMPAKLNPPKQFSGDPYQYVYKYNVPYLLNGWQYLFGVEAYDKGDPATGTPSQTSIRETEEVFPGPAATTGDSPAVGVFPNPYYTKAIWDGTGERERKIYFYNLPARCEIRIYTIAGDIVATLEHNAATYNGSDIQWFQQYDSDNKQIMPGGLHAWDLISDADQAIATGLYLFTVKDLANGNIERGKFLVIK
ncbi:MAG: hypothetical protein WAO19_00105 [Candidatus Kryptoniota bacterium]